LGNADEGGTSGDSAIRTITATSGTGTTDTNDTPEKVTACVPVIAINGGQFGPKIQHRRDGGAGVTEDRGIATSGSGRIGTDDEVGACADSASDAEAEEQVSGNNSSSARRENCRRNPSHDEHGEKVFGFDLHGMLVLSVV
jgi:hypothetical protein